MTHLQVLLVSLLIGISSPAFAGIHTWDVSEVFSNADGTIQFVELRENGGGNNEGGVGDGNISSNTQFFSWSNGSVTDTLQKYYLVATQSFADLPGAPTPDAIIAPGIIPFFSTSGDDVSFSIWDTCSFGPVPTDGVHSYDCLSNTTGVNSPTNFAGATGIVTAGGTPTSIALGHVDDFESETLQDWAGGPGPANQPTGGPLGTDDAYLEIGPGVGGLGVFNLVQWSGDYETEGVTQVDFDLNNFGPDPLSLRIVLFTPGCDLGGAACTAWASTVATPLAAGSGWVNASFSLDEADLTQVLGSDTHSASLQNVERLLIRHDDGAPDPPGVGTLVDATLGIDNVTALPEPAGLGGLVGGAAFLLARRRGRRKADRG